MTTLNSVECDQENTEVRLPFQTGLRGLPLLLSLGDLSLKEELHRESFDQAPSKSSDQES